MDIKLVDRGNEGELILSGRLDTANAENAVNVFLLTSRFSTMSKNSLILSSVILILSPFLAKLFFSLSVASFGFLPLLYHILTELQILI